MLPSADIPFTTRLVQAYTCTLLHVTGNRCKKVANNGVEFTSHSLTNEYAEPCMHMHLISKSLGYSTFMLGLGRAMKSENHIHFTVFNCRVLLTKAFLMWRYLGLHCRYILCVNQFMTIETKNAHSGYVVC